MTKDELENFSIRNSAEQNVVSYLMMRIQGIQLGKENFFSKVFLTDDQITDRHAPNPDIDLMMCHGLTNCIRTRARFIDVSDDYETSLDQYQEYFEYLYNHWYEVTQTLSTFLKLKLNIALNNPDIFSTAFRITEEDKAILGRRAMDYAINRGIFRKYANQPVITMSTIQRLLETTYDPMVRIQRILLPNDITYSQIRRCTYD